MMFFAAIFLLSVLTVVMLIRAIEYGVRKEANTKETAIAGISFALLNMVLVYIIMVS